MTINVDNLKVLVIEKENIDTYYDFVKLVDDGGDYSKEELIKILDDGGQIFMFKHQNVIASSCMFLRLTDADVKKLKLDVNYNEAVMYGPLYVFEDFSGNDIEAYMLDRLREICKRLGFKYSVIKNDSTLQVDSI